MNQGQDNFWDEYWCNKQWSGSHLDLNDYRWASDTAQIGREEHRKHFVEPILHILNLKPHHHVLEIGCGSGLLLQEIIGLAERVVGTDISQVALDHYNGPAQTICCPANEIPFDGPNFDRIFMYGVCFYFPSVEYFHNVLLKCISLLKPNGFVFIGDVVFQSRRMVNQRFLRCDISETMEFLDGQDRPYEIIAHNKLQKKHNGRKHLIIYERYV